MRPEKQLIVDEVQKQIGGSPFLLLTDYSGLTVGHFTDLRKRLMVVSAECHVVKNSMLQRAIEAAGLPKPASVVNGMTAMIFGKTEAEITAVAKILKQFAKETDKGKVKFGYMGSEQLAPQQVTALADLPGKDEMRARFVGLLKTPATRVATVLAAPASQLARVLKARAEKLGDETPAAAETPPATEVAAPAAPEPAAAAAAPAAAPGTPAATA